MQTVEKRQREYRDVLTLMNERTGATIEALTRAANPWRVFEGVGPNREVTQALLEELERQKADLDYLINADKQI